MLESFEDVDPIIIIGLVGLVLLVGSFVATFVFSEAKSRRVGYLYGNDILRPRPSYLLRAGVVVGLVVVAAIGYRVWLGFHETKKAEQISVAKTVTPVSKIQVQAQSQPERPAPEHSAKDENFAKGSTTYKGGNAAVDVETLRRSLESDIRAWVKAWEAQRVDEYLGYYSSKFVPANGSARSTWEADRHERIGRAKNLLIAIEEINFLRVDAAQAEVAFRQHYKSSTLKEDSQKVLSLAYEGGHWRITKEESKR